MRQIFRRTFYSFPVQLFVLHLRSNHLLLGIWIFLSVVIGGGIAAKFGIRYLFLDPEYLGTSGFQAFFFIGLAFGCFFLTWNLTTYLLALIIFHFWLPCHTPSPSSALITWLSRCPFPSFISSVYWYFSGASTK